MKKGSLPPSGAAPPAEVTAVLDRADIDFVSADEHTRWQAAIAIGAFSETYPEAVWPLVEKWGSSADEDIRTAIATCVLEHVMEARFQPYFARTAALINGGNAFFADTFCGCWKLGEAKKRKNSAMFDRLEKKAYRLRDKAGLRQEPVELPF